MNPFYHSSTPADPLSLHNFRQEHDNCGMGAIAHIRGEPSHSIIELALHSALNMTHRGAVDADMNQVMVPVCSHVLSLRQKYEGNDLPVQAFHFNEFSHVNSITTLYENMTHYLPDV
jgi:hypothetical protein